MDIQADSIFVMGNSHLVCQDYARHFTETERDNINLIIVSDGCSSSVDSDIGSRLITLATEDLLRRMGSSITPMAVAVQARSTSRILNLKETCLDATLLFVFYNSYQNNIVFSAFGDGVFAARVRGTKEWDLIHIEYPHGAPCYPSYFIREDRFKALVQHGLSIKHTIERLDLENKIFETVYSVLIEEDTVESTPICEWFSTDTHDLFVVMSDGIESFVDKSTSPWRSVKHSELLYDLLDFKNTNGEFVTRRVKKFLKNMGKRNWVHEDDLSLAALYIGN